MFLVIFIVLNSVLVNSEVIYPNSRTYPVQWIQTGIWKDCVTDQLIHPISCNEDDTKFIECFVIPQTGLCSGQITTSIQELYLLIESKVGSQCEISVSFNNDIQRNFSLDQNIKNIIIPLQNHEEQVSFKISLASGDDCYLMKTQLQTDEHVVGCEEQSEDLECKSCQPQYFKYYGSCFIKDCYNQIYETATTAITSNLAQVDQNVVQTINMSLGECILPIIYLLKNFDEPVMTYVFPQNYVSRIETKSIILTIPLEEVRQLPCDQLETSSALVTQCYISVVATLNGIVQVQFVTLLRVNILKGIQTQAILTEKSFQIPATCCLTPTIDVLSEALIYDVVLINEEIHFFVNQTLLDPTYSTYQILFQNATLVDGNEQYKLSLFNTVFDESLKQISYELSLDKSILYNQNTAYIEIVSLLSQISRLLEMRIAANIKPNYIMRQSLQMPFIQVVISQTSVQGDTQQKAESSIDTSQTDNELSQTSLILLIVILTSMVVIGIILYCIFGKPRATTVPTDSNKVQPLNTPAECSPQEASKGEHKNGEQQEKQNSINGSNIIKLQPVNQTPVGTGRNNSSLKPETSKREDEQEMMMESEQKEVQEAINPGNESWQEVVKTENDRQEQPLTIND